jgi:hypothetical protein
MQHLRRVDCLDPQPQKPSYAPDKAKDFTGKDKDQDKGLPIRDKDLHFVLKDKD